jgi:hypothetical protein
MLRRHRIHVLHKSLDRFVRLRATKSYQPCRLPDSNSLVSHLTQFCYRVEHRGHSYYKSKKVLDNTGAPVKSSVHVNGVSNRRGVWRVNYACLFVFCKEYRFCS